MQIKIKKDLYEVNVLNVHNSYIYIGDRKYSFNEVSIIIDDEEFPLHKLYNQLNKIIKRYKLKECLISIGTEYENMEVSINHLNDKIIDITILIGSNFIKGFTEEEILIYLAHEIGHVMDFNFVRRKSKYMDFFKIIDALIIMGFPIWYYYQFGFNEYYFIKIFSGVMILVGIMIFKLKYLDAFLSRKQEYNADSNAVRIVGDVTKVINAFNALQYEFSNFDEKSSIFSTHPSLNQRINYLKTKYFYHYIIRFFLLK